MRNVAARQRRERIRPVEPPSVAGRVPPHDLDAEAACLSACMLHAPSIDRVLEILTPEHMYSRSNAYILEAILELSRKAHGVDVLSVKGFLEDTGKLAAAGGAAYLAQILDAVPAVANVALYAQRVRDKSTARRIIAAAQLIAAEGYGELDDVRAYQERAEAAMFELGRAEEAHDVLPVRVVLTESFTQISEAATRGEAITGIESGFEKLDAMTAGLHDGDLTVIAARPGMGKSALALNIATNVACPRQILDARGQPVEDAPPSPGFGVVVFSLEMPKEQLSYRMMCSEGRVDVGKLRAGHLRQDDWARLTESASFLSSLPIWIDSSTTLGLLDLRAKVRRVQAEYNKGAPGSHDEQRVGLVIVDYLQLMKPRDGLASREQEVSDLSRGMKLMAKELRVPIIALCQLNRAVETRSTKDKRPQLSDLRDSGAIEQDADNIIFVYRDDYYFADSKKKGLAELIVAKQRNGPTGKVFTRFHASCTRFDNLDPSDYPNEEGE